ncbi:MAG: hypothetical protein R6X21_04150 [Candidatus Aminicenantes bacterium]
MKQVFALGLALVLTMGVPMSRAAAHQEQQEAAAETQVVSWDNWRAAKLKAEEFDGNGQMLEVGLAIGQATEDCRKVLESNLAYVKMFLGSSP